MYGPHYGILGRMDALLVEELSKRYGRTAAVDGLSFTVPAGRVCGFLGPNGAGKTTTLRILLGLTRASAGRAEVSGRVSGVLDRDGFHPGRTARDELALVAAVLQLVALVGVLAVLFAVEAPRREAVPA